MEQGVLVVISGFSGAGKGTVIKALMEQYDNYALSVSVTTREPRPGEVHGRHYFFITDERFEEMAKNHELIEFARYVKHSYGTPREYVEARMAEGRDVILEIEIQGALQVKKLYPEAALIFMTPPTAAELKRRLTERGTETSEVIEARMQRAVEESEGMELYDYLLVNDTVEQCVEDLHHLIQSRHLKINQNGGRITRMRQELKDLCK